MSRTKNTVRNIITGFIYRIICIILPFIIRTVIIKELGSEYLGLGSLFSSILQVLNLTELGFSSAVVFSMYKPMEEKDDKTICALLNFYKKAYFVIGTIIIGLGLALLPFLTKLIHGSYPNEINIYILYLIYLFNTAITYFLFAYKSALIIADQRNDIINNINIFSSIMQYIAQIIVLLKFKNYYLYILMQTIMTIVNNLIIEYISRKKYSQYYCKGNISKEENLEIKKRVYGLMIQKICGTTRNSLDSIFLSAFLGLNIVAMYNNYYYILNAITAILVVIINNMTASVGNSIVTETVEKNYYDMKKFNFIYMWISGWCTVCLLCLYQPFMELWMGKEYMFTLGTVICFCIYFYALKTGDILFVYTQASGIWYEGRYKAIAETICNIVLNYILGKLFGVNGIILATVISLITIGFIWGTQIVFKYYFKNISVKEYYFNHLGYMIITILASIITFALCNLISLNGIIGLIVKALICIIIPNIIYFIFYFKTRMFKESSDFLKNIIGRKRKWNLEQ